MGFYKGSNPLNRITNLVLNLSLLYIIQKNSVNIDGFPDLSFLTRFSIILLNYKEFWFSVTQ